MRIGHGYDVHRLVEGRRLILGGVEIPFEKGLDGHSDADVLTHAVMDALLGAAALGDIGKHFPDNDVSYLGADSIELLKAVSAVLTEHGWRLGNLDATVIAQRPKLAPYIDAMRARIAAALGADVSAVSIKATTEQGDSFDFYTQSVATDDAFYFFFSNRTQLGNLVDTSRVPGGYGVYRLPYGWVDTDEPYKGQEDEPNPRPGLEALRLRGAVLRGLRRIGQVGDGGLLLRRGLAIAADERTAVRADQHIVVHLPAAVITRLHVEYSFFRVNKVRDGTVVL